jgi:soluble lytic murein transglycosylase-like protein
MQTRLKVGTAAVAVVVVALGCPVSDSALAQQSSFDPLAALAAAAQALEPATSTADRHVLDDASSGPGGPIRRNAAPPTDGPALPPALAQAEAAFAADKPREALDRLDAASLPAEVGDLVTLRRAELAYSLGDRERARAEIAKPELAESGNRVVLVRAAALADRLGERGTAAELWLRSARYFSWIPERAHALSSAALDFARVNRPDRAGETLTRLAEIGLELPAASKELAPMSSLGAYHAGVVAALGGDKAAAARQLRRYLAERPNGDYAEAARKRLASLDRPAVDLAWIAARDQNTVESYRNWVRAYPNNPRVPDARFFEGLVQFRAGQYPLALETWKGWTSPEVEVEARARAIYWSGRAYEALGQPDEARLHWQDAAATRPSSYYSVRARDRLNGVLGWPDASGALRSAAPTAAEEAAVAEWIAGWAGAARDPSAADAAALRRGSIFAALGLARTADAELDRLIRNTDDPRVLYRAGRLAQESGSWMASLRAGLRLGAMSPAKTSLEAPVGVRLLSYPIAYRDEVRSAAERTGLGPILLLSLMRQESLFDRFAHSTAEARGLTQVIPTTGATVAAQLGLAAFQPEELFDPAQSITFGSYHLADRVKLFNGDVFRAVAAYNAGPDAVATWAPGSDDADIFVESIDYGATRGYLKMIYEYQSIYRGVLAASAGGVSS